MVKKRVWVEEETTEEVTIEVPTTDERYEQITHCDACGGRAETGMNLRIESIDDEFEEELELAGWWDQPGFPYAIESRRIDLCMDCAKTGPGKAVAQADMALYHLLGDPKRNAGMIVEEMRSEAQHNATWPWVWTLFLGVLIVMVTSPEYYFYEWQGIFTIILLLFIARSMYRAGKNRARERFLQDIDPRYEGDS